MHCIFVFKQQFGKGDRTIREKNMFFHKICFDRMEWGTVSCDKN